MYLPLPILGLPMISLLPSGIQFIPEKIVKVAGNQGSDDPQSWRYLLELNLDPRVRTRAEAALKETEESERRMAVEAAASGGGGDDDDDEAAASTAALGGGGQPRGLEEPPLDLDLEALKFLREAGKNSGDRSIRMTLVGSKWPRLVQVRAAISLILPCLLLQVAPRLMCVMQCLSNIHALSLCCSDFPGPKACGDCEEGCKACTRPRAKEGR